MLHRSTLDKASRPGLRFQGWKALPLGSKIAIVVLCLIALIAILAPVVAPYSPGATVMETPWTMFTSLRVMPWKMSWPIPLMLKIISMTTAPPMA